MATFYVVRGCLPLVAFLALPKQVRAGVDVLI
jgi:hypothetical protein